MHKTPLSHIKNSLDLIQKIEHVQIPDNHILVSFDVIALYTNVPNDLVIESLDKRCSLIHQNSSISYDYIIKCTKFLFENTYFKANDDYYKQHHGMPVGSSISGLFADIVMEDFKSSCIHLLKSQHQIEISFIYRYVDDLVLCISKEHLNIILKTFNS